jgi:coenzyme PQQ precursor peptide PqqA
MILVGDADIFAISTIANGLGELTMKTWKTPRLREICVGLEINSYACARL